MVRNLEERLGVRLVEPTTRSVAPTTAGERLLERLRPVLDEYQSALESANEFRGRPAGLLRLTAPPPAADFFLGSAIPRFLAQYPEISLDLSFNDALTDIVAERFDAGIRIGERIERDMIAVRVTDELPHVVAGSPAYFAQRGKPKSPKDLVAHDCVRIRFVSGAYLPWRFRVKRRDLEVHVERRLVVNSGSLARQVAIEGLALIQTPLLFIASDLSEGKLTTVLENLMDLSHLSYLHKSSIGSSEADSANASMDVKPTARGIRFLRVMRGADAPPNWRKRYKTLREKVDRWSDFEYVAPNVIMQYSGGVNSGEYDAGIREGGHNVRTLHAITPETEKSCFYFFNKADGYAKFEPLDTVRTWESTTDVFKEDAFMLEQQQLRLNNYDTNKLLNINTDVAHVQMILALNERLRREREFAVAG